MGKFFLEAEMLRKIENKNKRKILYRRRNAGISSRISPAGSESDARGGFSLPLSPRLCTQGERAKDGGQIGCISTEVIGPICVMWLQTEQTAASGDEISPMLPGPTLKSPTQSGPLVWWELLCCHLIALSNC